MIPSPATPYGGVHVPAMVGPAAPNLAYGTRSDQKLDIYLPSAARFPGARPLLIWLHSGGWVSGTRKEPAALAQYELSRGFAFAAVEYGLAPAHHFPTPVYDVKQALRWLRQHANTYHLNPNMVIIIGYSAGAGLGTLVALTPGKLESPHAPASLAGYSDAVQGLISISGVYNFAPLATSQNLLVREILDGYLHCIDPGIPHLLNCQASFVHDASAISWLTKAAPPVYFIQGTDDELFLANQQLKPMAQKWNTVTGSVQGAASKVWVQTPNTGHGIDLSLYNLPAINQFLAEVTSHKI